MHWKLLLHITGVEMIFTREISHYFDMILCLTFQINQLFFMGVKIKICDILIFIYQNGSLLRRYTYLSNDSSYSVSPEDGVDILLLDESSYANDETNLNYMDETSDASDTSGYTHSDSSKMQSFTFEAQVGHL